MKSRPQTLARALISFASFHQMHITKYVWRVDYAGIVILIVTSFVPFVYYGFLCQRRLLIFYLVSTTAMGEPLLHNLLLELCFACS